MAKAKNETKKDQNLTIMCAKARMLLAKAERHDILARYKVAELIKSVIDSAKYGEGALPKMEELLGLDQQTLYAYGRVAEIWSAAEFKKIAAEVTKKGLPLTWSHLKLLASVTDGRKRRGLTSRALNESWTCRQLDAEMKSADPGTTEDLPEVSSMASADTLNTSPTDEPAKPSPRDIAGDLVGWVNGFEKEVASWDERLLGDVGVAKNLDQAEAAKLTETVSRLDSIAKSMQGMVAKLRVLLAANSPGLTLVPDVKAPAVATQPATM